MKMINLNEDSHLEEVQRKIDYSFNTIDLLLQAFIRSSYSAQFGGENNEVLEFIGDKVLDMYVTKIIADKFGFMKSQSDYYDKEEDNDEYCIVAHHNEGDFTELRKTIVNNKTLAKRIDKFGFAKYLYLGDSDLDNNVVNQEKVKTYMTETINGIAKNKEEILELISQNLKEKWDISRVSKINITLLKLATYEIVYTELPYKVVVNEAVEIAKKYGDDTSPAFINGVLANIIKQTGIANEE